MSASTPQVSSASRQFRTFQMKTKRQRDQFMAKKREQ
jgi:hypothetical protein